MQVAPTVTVDGKSVPVGEVETPLLNITLPADNLFGLRSGTEGQSVAHGWVTLLNPLTPPGSPHTSVIKSGESIITTKIDVVQPGLNP